MAKRLTDITVAERGVQRSETSSRRTHRRSGRSALVHRLQITRLGVTAEAIPAADAERAPEGARPFEKTRGGGRQKVRPKLNTGRGGGA